MKSGDHILVEDTHPLMCLYFEEGIIVAQL